MKIKLIYLPRIFMGLSSRFWQKRCLFPPIGIAKLKAVLEREGYKTDQDDLDIKVDYDTKYSVNPLKKAINLPLFEDRERLKNFIKTKHDPELEEEAEKILKKTKYKGYDIIGLSMLDELSFSVISIACFLSKIIKERTGSTIVVGGLKYPRPVIELEHLLNTKYIDYIVHGHGEFPFLNICYGLEKGCIDDIELGEVISKRKKKSCLREGPYQKEAVNRFCRPDFDGLPLDLYKYKPTGETKKLSSKKISVLMLPYLFVDGCPNHCIFCPLSYSEGCVQNPEIVASDLEYLSKRYRTRYFFFINSNFNPTYEYARNIVKEFKKKDLNILWNDSANLRQLDEQLLRKMREAGAVKIIYGLECPSDKMLKYIKKGITVEKAEKMLKASHEAGVWNEVDLITGLPYETDNDIKACTTFLERNKEQIDYSYVARFVLKDSLIYKHPEEYGITNVSENVNTIYNLQEFTRKFDEANGLKWEQKYLQIMHSWEIVSKKADELLNKRGLKYNPGNSMPLLFYLYTVLGTKEEVKAHFNQCYSDYNNDLPNEYAFKLKEIIRRII